MRRLGLLLAVTTLMLPSFAAAQDDGGSCLTADPPPPGDVQPLRFGITPRVAGTAGTAQEEPAPEDLTKNVEALKDLRPRHRKLVLRLNRLFWSEGTKGIREMGRLVRHYALAGFRSEIQVRYHPPEGHEGDIEGFEEFVATAVQRLGKRRAVVGFSITNEANLPISPNTSDGAYDGVVDALVRGVIVARRELRKLGRGKLDVGFNVMWRWNPDTDRQFWEDIGAHPDAARFRKAVDNVGLQVYPGLVWPPVPLPGRTAGDEIAEALTLVRDCYMPKAQLGREVELWVSENGYATNLGRSEESQRRDLESSIEAVARWSGALGITDYRWFNLRDNNSDGADLFSAVGLLRDDYSRKPAFAEYRRAIKAHGR
ncbi:MAG: hypothetical protein ACRDJY_11985 [Thermoleophilaceae bacterium]